MPRERQMQAMCHQDVAVGDQVLQQRAQVRRHFGVAPARFEHVAVWNAEQRWIEMRLRATSAMTVRLPAVDMVVELAAFLSLRKRA